MLQHRASCLLERCTRICKRNGLVIVEVHAAESKRPLKKLKKLEGSKAETDDPWADAQSIHAAFGVSPPLLVERDDVLDRCREALEDGPGSDGRATVCTGARGAGKTVMLKPVEDIARAQGGW